jgi:hypothetical protein
VLRAHPEAALHVLPWALSVRRGRSAIAEEMPWVPFVARRWLEHRLRPDMEAFEWGSGGSTFFFARRVARVVSVEHDEAWGRIVRSRLEAQDVRNCDYRLAPGEAGRASAGFGSGHRGAEHLDFENYVREIERFPDECFDVVMIDGRARLACLELSWSKVGVGGIVFLDNSDYPRYQQGLGCPANFRRQDFSGVLPYGGAVWARSTAWLRTE